MDLSASVTRYLRKKGYNAMQVEPGYGPTLVLIRNRKGAHTMINFEGGKVLLMHIDPPSDDQLEGLELEDPLLFDKIEAHILKNDEKEWIVDRGLVGLVVAAVCISGMVWLIVRQMI